MLNVLILSASEEMVSTGIKKLETGIAKIKSELNHHLVPQDSEDRFNDVMKGWVLGAEEKFKKVQDQYLLMGKKYDELAEFYCFDRKKVPMDEFFGDLTQFCKEFDVSIEDYSWPPLWELMLHSFY